MLTFARYRYCSPNRKYSESCASRRDHQRTHDRITYKNYQFASRERLDCRKLSWFFPRHTHTHAYDAWRSICLFHSTWRSIVLCAACILCEQLIMQYLLIFFFRWLRLFEARSNQTKKKHHRTTERHNLHSICGMTHHEHRLLRLLRNHCTRAKCKNHCINGDCSFRTLIGGWGKSFVEVDNVLIAIRRHRRCALNPCASVCNWVCCAVITAN